MVTISRGNQSQLHRLQPLILVGRVTEHVMVLQLKQEERGIAYQKFCNAGQMALRSTNGTSWVSFCLPSSEKAQLEDLFTEDCSLHSTQDHAKSWGGKAINSILNSCFSLSHWLLAWMKMVVWSQRLTTASEATITLLAYIRIFACAVRGQVESPVESHRPRKDHILYNILLNELHIEDSCGFYEYYHMSIENYKKAIPPILLIIIHQITMPYTLCPIF